MQLDSHRWTIKMRGRIKVPSWAILIPTILFVSPSLIWLALDHSVWRFDQASYARDTLDLYRVLRGNPHHWPLAMLNAVVSKAPGMVWFGQFFLPLRYMLKSPEAALLTSICVCQIFALLFLVSALRNAFPKKGAIIYLAAILVTAASPIFIGLSQQYLVESSQIFAVSIFIWIVSHAHTRRADILFIELVTATAAAMMAKLTSPVYTCIFGIYILFKIIKNRGNAKRLPPVSLLERNVFFITCLIFITATLGWYFRNFRELWALSINSASGPMSLLYGHRLPFFSKMLLWLQVAEQSTFVKVFMPPIMILTVLGAWFGEKKMPVVPMLCVLQGGFFLAAASFQVNEDIRFFAPVLPSLTMVIAWVLSKQRKPLLASVLGIVLITQWGYLHGHALGLLHFDHRYTNYKWNGTYLSEYQDSRPVQQSTEELIKRVCDGRWRVLVGAETAELGEGTLLFYTTRDLSRPKLECDLDGLPLGGNNVKEAWALVAGGNYKYFVTFSDRKMDDLPEIGTRPDPFNHLSRPMAALVAKSAVFQDITPPDIARDYRVFISKSENFKN